MESINNINHSLLIILISSFLSSSSAEAIFVSRYALFDETVPSSAPTASSPSPSPSFFAGSSPSPPPSPSPASSSSLPLHGVKLHAVPGVSPAVRDICHKTDYPLLCISSLLPYLAAGGGRGKTDVLSVLHMEIEASLHASQRALDAVSRMVEEPSTPSETKENLEVCKENYSDAIDNLKDAEAAIPTGDVGRLNSVLSAVLSDFGTCEDGFADSAPGSTSPTARYYDPLRKLASNCLAISSLIH